MRRRFAPTRALLLAPFLAAAFAACSDESPTLTGDDLFPGGSRPVTLEVLVPAADFLTTLGVYTGFADRHSFPFLVVANEFGGPGGLTAHALVTFTFPDEITYSQGGETRFDSLYTVRSARLLLQADSASSASGPAATVEAWELAQGFHPATVTWELAVDSVGGQVAWTEPGGTRGPLLGSASYTRGVQGDSVLVVIDSAEIVRLRTDNHPGVLITAGESNRRVQLVGATLLARVRPSNATRDTTIDLQVLASSELIFTPEPPTPPNTLLAGGIYAARSVFRLNLDRPLPGCPAPQSCAPLTLRDVQLNQVALLLRPVATPLGFDPLGDVPLTLWTVPEPELGRRAPLGRLVLDVFTQNGPVSIMNRADSVISLPLTGFANEAARSDSLPDTFALLGEAPPLSVQAAPRAFGVAAFEPAPRLRIVYTLPLQPRLP